MNTPSRENCCEAFNFLRLRANLLILTLNREGVIVQSNPYARSLLGKELNQKKFLDIVVDFRDEIRLENLLEEKDKNHLLTVVTAENQPNSFYFNFRVIEGSIHAIGQQDISELKQIQKEVLSLNRELNNLTRLLHKKNAQLAVLNQEKNRFLGMAAHDLRKPIGLVITYADFLYDEAGDAMDSEHVQFLETIQSSCSYMKRLVDDFLDVSIIESGSLTLEKRMVCIKDIVEKSLELNSIQARKKGVALEVKTSDRIPEVSVDFEKVEQVITNLVSNAIEHSHPGSIVTLTIDSTKEKLTLKVRDYGVGMSVDQLNTVFSPFSNNGSKKTGGEKSTGLGLTIAKKIITAHGGDIRVKSKEGNGSIFSFTLPLSQEKR